MPNKTIRLLLLFLTFLSVSLAASPTSFCKCTCFNKNSTLIPLDGTAAGKTCADCTKQFCLDNNLPICKSAGEEDVFTTCFQRDSTKDQLVVYIFIFATGSLLVWAAVRPWWERWRGGGVYTGVGTR